jgi:hypothetical protein
VSALSAWIIVNSILSTIPYAALLYLMLGSALFVSMYFFAVFALRYVIVKDMP